jgi:hypothetical protein
MRPEETAASKALKTGVEFADAVEKKRGAMLPVNEVGGRKE